MLALLEYAYTGRLNVPRNQVRTLYMLANRMRMLPVAQHCARHLLSNLTVQNCLPLRSTSGLRHDPPLLCAVDAFVRDHASQVLNSPAAQRLPRVHLDLLHSGLRPAQCVNRCRLFDLALHWMRQQLQQRRLKVDSLTSRSFMLYLDQLDHRLHDCMQLSSLDVQYSEAVHEYQCLGRGQCHEEGCAGEVEHHALEPNVNIFSNAVDEDRQRSVKSKEISRSVDGIGRSQDLHSLLDTEEDRAHLPCLIELEDQWAMQQGKQSATGSGSQLKMKLQQLSGRDTVVDADETSEHDSNSRASNGNKPCLLTRSDSSSSLSSLPDEDEGDWKLLATDCLTKHTLVALAMAAGRLCMIHIRLRVAQSNMSPGTIDEATTSPSNGKAALSKVEGQAWSESTEFVTVKDIVGKPQYITLAPLPRGRSALGVVAIEGRLLVCGGYDRSECLRSVDLYDPNTNSWTACASMQEPRGRFALTVVDERVFAIGGSNGQKDLNSVEQFVNNQWSFVGNCPSVRSYAGVCELNGKVYVIGGWRALQRCDVYDPASDCWTRIADLNVGTHF